MADNETQLLGIFDKLQNFPSFNATGKSISRNWCGWKQKFLSFLQKEDPRELYKNQWTIILLMLIGEEARKNLSQNVHQKDLKTVLCELDIYFIFGLRRKQYYENIDKYIDSLMFLAISSNHSDPVSVVKEKIIQEIKNYNFTGKAMLLTQSKGESLISHLQSLNINNITLFWKQCEFMSQKNHVQNQQPSNSQSAETECVRCGTCHDRHRCPAYGTQCNNCKGYNHFTHNCKVKYVSDCPKCGTHHVQSRCLAFGELCENCGKVNHFSWLCQVPTVKDCPRCGRDHAISMCPAQGRVCPRCKKPNHLKEKCLTKVNDEQK